MIRQRYALVPLLSVLILSGFYGLYTLSNQTTEFATTSQFREWAAAQGFNVWPPEGDWHSILVSDKHSGGTLKSVVYTSREIVGVESWEGLVVVVKDTPMERPPLGEAVEWGSLVVYGDPKLIHRLKSRR